MTLRVRLMVAFFVVLLGPALFGASVLAGVLPRRTDADGERATAAVRLALIARCQHLEATAQGLALQVAVTGEPFAVTPRDARGPWALCDGVGAESVPLPVGTRYAGLAARTEVRDANGLVIGHAYAVQPLDPTFLRQLSVQAGAEVTLLAVGDPAAVQPDLLLPFAVSPPSSAAPSQPDEFTAVLAAALVAGVVAGLLSWWLAGLAVRPLQILLKTVEHVAAGDLNARSLLHGRDETGRLGTGLDQLIAGMQETQRLSVTDALTGLGNVRHLGDSLRLEIERASRFGRTLGVLVLDLDHFKAVNDRHGHRAGDAVLVEFALRIRGVIREVDLAFRQGGEEFVILLPETDVQGSLTAARRIGDAVRNTPFEVGGRRTDATMRITVSIGVAVYPRHALTGQSVLDAADEALYAAKAAGRDTFVLANGVLPEQRIPTRTVDATTSVVQAGGASGGTTPTRESPGG